MPYSTDHKERTKQRILQSATDLFCRYGFENVSINQVMKLAKMTHGAFYAHFESKIALYKASFQEAMKENKSARLMKEPFSMQSLMDLVTGYLDLGGPDKSSSLGTEAFLANDIGNNNVEIKQLYEKSYMHLIQLFEKRLTALTKLKTAPLDIDISTIPEKARAISASMIGALAIAKSINEKDERQAVLTAAQKQIFNIIGIRKNTMIT